MTEDSQGDKVRLPKLKVNKKTLIKHARKVEKATTKHAHKFIVKRWSNVREVRKHVIGWILVMSILIAATGLQLMWFQQSYRTVTGGTDGTYVEAVLGTIDTLNPLFAGTSAEQSSSYLMFSRLLSYDRTGNLNYDLASDVEIDKTNKEYTVRIRPDVKWHDGIKLTADDVAFTVDLIKDDDTRSTISGWDNILVKVVDDTTVKFTLSGPYAAFEHALTFPIIPKHILGEISPNSIRENEFSRNPIGSGPFKFNFIQDVDSNSERKVIHMTRNNDYYRGKAKLARFQLQTYMTTDGILKALSSNEVNAAADLLSTDLGHINTKRYSITSNSIQSGTYAIINIDSVILKDINLRKALRLATDTDAIRSKLAPGAKVLDLPFTDGQLTGKVPKAPAYDVAEAKKILDSKGWKLDSNSVRKKGGKELRLSVVALKNSELEMVLETLVNQWQAAGFAIDSKIVDPNDVTQNVAQDILQPRNFDVFLHQLNIGADPDVYAYWHSSQASISGSNFANYANVISDDTLSSARIRLEPNLRNAKYITFAKQWLSDVPAIGLYQVTAQYISNKNVQSYNKANVLVSPVDRYSDVLNWSVGTSVVYKTP